MSWLSAQKPVGEVSGKRDKAKTGAVHCGAVRHITPAYTKMPAIVARPKKGGVRYPSKRFGYVIPLIFRNMW